MPFYPTNNQKNQNFEKIKKIPLNIIILHMCTKDYDQMTYGSWDMVRDRCNCYFSFCAIFYPPNSPKNQYFEKMKKSKTPKDIIILHMCTQNYNQMMYGSWDMVRSRQMDRETDG